MPEALADLPGAAGELLADGVVYLDPASAVFEAMLEGWARQQRVRFLQAETINGRVDLVRRLAEFSNQYPWQWRAAEVEAFVDHLRSGPRPIVVSTARILARLLGIHIGVAVHRPAGPIPAIVDSNLPAHPTPTRSLEMVDSVPPRWARCVVIPSAGGRCRRCRARR